MMPLVKPCQNQMTAPIFTTVILARQALGDAIERHKAALQKLLALKKIFTGYLLTVALRLFMSRDYRAWHSLIEAIYRYSLAFYNSLAPGTAAYDISSATKALSTPDW